MTNETGYPAPPKEPTPEMLKALRVGSFRDYPSDDMCRVRYAALCAAISVYHAQRATADKALLSTARAVIERWDSPLWKDAEPTAAVINRLRKAVDMHTKAGNLNTSPAPVKKTAESLQVEDEALMRQALDAITTDRHDVEYWPETSRNAIAAIRSRLSKSKGVRDE